MWGMHTRWPSVVTVYGGWKNYLKVANKKLYPRQIELTPNKLTGRMSRRRVPSHLTTHPRVAFKYYETSEAWSENRPVRLSAPQWPHAENNFHSPPRPRDGLRQPSPVRLPMAKTSRCSAARAAVPFTRSGSTGGDYWLKVDEDE